MPSFLKSNLEALRRRNPDLARRIEILDSRLPSYLELVPTKTPLAALRYHPPGEGNPRALCSAYDPVREARRWAENDPVSSAINLIFLGIGLGYHVMAYLDRFGRFAKTVTLVESDAHLFRLALTALDLRKVIDNESCFCFVGEKPEDFPDLLTPLRTRFMVDNFKILHHRPSQQVQPDYYLKVAREIVEVATYDGVNTKTVLGQRQRNQHNVLKNLPAFWRGRMPAEYRDAARGLPAFVVAAGPSLDRNVRELLTLGHRGVIIAVDTSQNTLARQGVHPHFVVAADPTELNFSHFDAISDLGDTILSFHPESYFGITRKFPSHPYLFPLVDEQGALLNYLREALRDCLGEVGAVTRGMNVGQIAFNIALHLGCDPIILVGMDFAFPPEGGTTHAQDAAVSRATSAVREDGFMVVGAKEGKAGVESGNLVFVPGYYGGQVPTTLSFQQYIKDLEESIRESSRRVIDATEGGARKEGAENLCLREIIDSLDSSLDIRPFLRIFHEPAPTRDPIPLILELRKGRAVLAKSQEIAEQSLFHISRWPGICNSHSLTPETAQREWTQLEELWQAMLADPLFNVFLDTSVTYLYYRRQKADQPVDGSPRAFLECMYNKYQFILTEMNVVLRYFINLLDEVCEEMSCNST